ncbi:MAG: gamma carbonic anhydrase family protein, partial [Myxococcota bacterium]
VIQPFGGFVPQVSAGAWVHESAVLIGQVELADGVSVWPTVVLRGDMGPIRVGRDTNLQDGTIAHDTTDRSETVVGERVTVGHRAVLHGCRIGDDCLVGMGSIVMDNAVVGAGSFVAAGSLVTPNTVIPPGSFVRGAPAKVIRPVEPRDTEAIAYSWKHYRDVMRQWMGS